MAPTILLGMSTGGKFNLMRSSPLSEKLESGRVTTGQFASDSSWGGCGFFYVFGPCGEELKIIASDGESDNPALEGWEHVSVSTRRRIPNWREMCFVKDLFWSDDEAVMQLHPPKSEYVNQHPFCLHLWRPNKQKIPLPPRILVGTKDPANPTPEEAVAEAKWRHA